MTTQTITLCLQLLTEKLSYAKSYARTFDGIKGSKREVKKANVYICKLEKAIEELNNEPR
jgi:hypothetical protein